MSTKTTRSGCNNLRPLIATRVSPRCKAPHLMRLAQTRHRTSGQECKKGVACVTMIHATNSCRLNSSREFRLIELYLPPPPPSLSSPARQRGGRGAEHQRAHLHHTPSESIEKLSTCRQQSPCRCCQSPLRPLGSLRSPEQDLPATHRVAPCNPSESVLSAPHFSSSHLTFYSQPALGVCNSVTHNRGSGL